MKASIENLKKVERQLYKEFKSESFLDTQRGRSLERRWKEMAKDLRKVGAIEEDYDFEDMLANAPY